MDLDLVRPTETVRALKRVYPMESNAAMKLVNLSQRWGLGLGVVTVGDLDLDARTELALERHGSAGKSYRSSCRTE